MFPRLYETIPCPLDGYAGFAFRVLLNPTGAEKTDWALGSLGLENCQDCAKLGTARGKQGNGTKQYCVRCQVARDQLGRATVAIYGTGHTDGFDFSTPDAALASFSQPDLPDELLFWLYTLPAALWAARAEDVKKKLPRSSTTGNSTPD